MEDEQIIYVRCKRCHRILRTDEAKVRGYGSFCWKQHKLEVQQKGDDLPLLFKVGKNLI